MDDEDGRHAAANQPDDVWFLAGTSGMRHQRSCAVPVGRDLEIGTPVPFTVAGARLNRVTGGKKPVPVSVWGRWKLVPALPPGEHHLQAIGTDGNGFVVDVSYRLLVSPAPQAWSVR